MARCCLLRWKVCDVHTNMLACSTAAALAQMREHTHVLEPCWTCLESITGSALAGRHRFLDDAPATRGCSRQGQQQPTNYVGTKPTPVVVLFASVFRPCRKFHPVSTPQAVSCRTGGKVTQTHSSSRSTSSSRRGRSQTTAAC
jgi:hypothetical protein